MRAPLTLFSSLVLYAVVSAQDAETGGTTESPLPDQTYLPIVIDRDFQAILEADRDQRPRIMERQDQLVKRRYDLRDDPSEVSMAGGRKAVQQGVRVRLPEGVTWEGVAAMSPREIKQKDLFPAGFRPPPHARHAVGGMVFPQNQIDAIRKAESRDLTRFDVAFDLPAHLTPEFPPPIFLSSRPDLGDVSRGKVLTIKNYDSIDISDGVAVVNFLLPGRDAAHADELRGSVGLRADPGLSSRPRVSVKDLVI